MFKVMAADWSYSKILKVSFDQTISPVETRQPKLPCMTETLSFLQISLAS